MLYSNQQADSRTDGFAAAIREALRTSDLVARIAGDEFAILLPYTEKAAAGQVLSRVWVVLDRAMRNGHRPVTFSIGAVTFVAPSASVFEMLQEADKAMYVAKQHGKNRLKQYETV